MKKVRTALARRRHTESVYVIGAGPLGITVDSGGAIFATDSTAFGGTPSGIVKVDPLTGVQTTISNPFAFAGLQAITTDANGANNQVLPIPSSASLLGLRTYWQSVVADAASPSGLGITLSDAFDAKIGDWTYTK